MLCHLGGEDRQMADDIHGRLKALGADLAAAEARLTAAGSSEHAATNAELKARYEALNAQVKAENADLEAHGHYVSALESSVRMWLDRIALDVP
jgi:K+-transporting ATPase c subunit